MAREKRWLSEAVFESLVSGMKIKPQILEGARLYMVEHRTLSEAEDLTGVRFQTIQRKVRQIWEKNQECCLPQGWIMDRVLLPEDEMARVKALSKRLLEEIVD